VVSYINQLDYSVEATIIKRDPSLLFDDISELDKFKLYDGPTQGGVLIGNHHVINYKQHRKNKQDYLLAFLEVLTIDQIPKYQLLDFLLIRVKPSEEISLNNFGFDGIDGEEILATYTAKNNNVAPLATGAWRFNRTTRKIEKVSKTKVRVKKSESNDFVIPVR
jgi:hypothetical protein